MLGGEELERDGDKVYILTEGVWGIVTEWGAYFSTVSYTKDRNDYEILIENEDLISESDYFEDEDDLIWPWEEK